MRIRALLALPVVLGCVWTPTEPAPKGIFALDPGTSVPGAVVSQSGVVAWGPRTGDVYFPSRSAASPAPSSITLDAVTPATGQTRTVYGASSTIYQVALTPGEDAVYVVRFSGGDDPPSLVRVRASDGEVAMVAPRVSLRRIAFGGAPHKALVSPDAKEVAYIVHGDSLYVHARATGTSRFVASPCTQLAAYAPASDAVICATDGPQGGAVFRTVDLRTGAVAALVAPGPEVFQNAMGFHWGANGIRVLYRVFMEVRLADLASQSTRALPTLPEDPSPSFEDALWSADGRTVAFWRSGCLTFGFKSCDLQYALSVVDLQDWVARRAAVFNVPATSFLGAYAMTPDATKVAYVVGATLYVKSIAP